jgi:hypothetical protein
MSNKNQQVLEDEILNRLHTIQFKSEILAETLSSDSNELFDILNDEKLKLLSNKRQCMNEINEAFKNKM